VSALRGRIVATTRGGEPGDRLVASLESQGAHVLLWPTLRFAEPRDVAPLDAAARALREYDWVVFTSARAVRELSGRARPVEASPQYGRRKSDVIPGPRVAAVGAATAAALRAAGWRVDVVGEDGAARLADAIAARHVLEKARVLFPAGSLASDRLEEGMRRWGALVERIEAYRTVPAPLDGAKVREDLRRGVDVVTFASPSAVRALREALRDDLKDALGDGGVAAIGPTTARALFDEGVTRVEIADHPTTHALVDACVLLTSGKRAS
jgi:uroporphyrinogen-III synthase